MKFGDGTWVVNGLGKLFELDELRVYRGRPLEIAPGIVIRQPTLDDIEGGEGFEADGGEKRFFTTVHTLIATPTDMMAQLDKIGIRYEDLSNYQLFMLMFPHMDKEDVRLLFEGDIVPSRFKPTKVEGEDRVVLGDAEDGLVIDEVAYGAMVGYICAFMQTEQTRFIKSANEFTRSVRMDLAYEEMDAGKDKGYQSILLPIISTMVNIEGFKYGWKEVWQMPIGAFMDSAARVQAIVSGKALLQGCYSGMIDTKKIDKKELNYMRRLTKTQD